MISSTAKVGSLLSLVVIFAALILYGREYITLSSLLQGLGESLVAAILFGLLGVIVALPVSDGRHLEFITDTHQQLHANIKELVRRENERDGDSLALLIEQSEAAIKKKMPWFGTRKENTQVYLDRLSELSSRFREIGKVSLKSHKTELQKRWKAIDEAYVDLVFQLYKLDRRAFSFGEQPF